jgi:hypothetical protein
MDLHLTSSSRDHFQKVVVAHLVRKFSGFMKPTWAVLWLRRLVGLSPRRPAFAPESVYVKFVVDEVEQGEVFLRVPLIFLGRIIPPRLPVHVYHLGMRMGPLMVAVQ